MDIRLHVGVEHGVCVTDIGFKSGFCLGRRCPIAIAPPRQEFQSVQDWDDPFLALFPHRFDFLYACYPQPGEHPDWKTERRYPLGDRLIQQADYLYGVRFCQTTQYFLLDIDRYSAYHPHQDPFAISRIQAVLEPLGLVAYVACTSSYSGGLHLYFPFEEAQNSWHLASAVATILNQAGFQLKPGQLELFPDPKPGFFGETPALFNGHRLPLQVGSYLVNDDFQPIWSDRQRFVQFWQLAQSRNTIDAERLQHLLKQLRRSYSQLSGRADKFLNDLNAEIELGWTGYGQTNRLLGRITMRTYIFHHVLHGGEPLSGQRLIDVIVEIARSLPGYREWCRHQHEIEHRVAEWVHSVEASHYFPYGTRVSQTVSSVDVLVSPSWNQRRSQATRDKICKAIADLLETNSLPSHTTARFHALLEFGIGGASLYRHRDLWHPQHLSDEFSTGFASFDGQLDGQLEQFKDQSENQNEKENYFLNSTNLLVVNDSNPLCDEGFSDRSPTLSISDSNSESVVSALNSSLNPQDRYQVEQLNRMQRYLDSGDPILMAEAIAWTTVHASQCNGDFLETKCLTNWEFSAGAQFSVGAHGHAPLQSVNSCPDKVLTASSLSVDFSNDLSDLIAAIDVQIRCLRWNREQVQTCLLEQFGKPHRALLSDLELRQWHQWLESQFTGVNSS